MLSDKQLRAFAFPWTDYDALICDGAVRSGKTSVMFASYVLWAMTMFDGRNFIVLGKTVGSAKRNVLDPFTAGPICPIDGEPYKTRWKKTEGVLEVSYSGHANRFHVFGAKDSSSYQLIQGCTAAGLFVDETALCDRDTVMQAMARCSVDGSKFFFNCNPESAEHWFYKEWILKSRERNALRLHFTMKDNPALSPRIRKRYESQYSGVFYRRYILGEWCMAEGLVYQFERDEIQEDIEPIEGEAVWVGVDYGITNPTACGMWCVRHGRAYMFDEWEFDSREEGYRLTNAKLYERMAAWIGTRNVQEILVDPSAAGFIEEIREHGRFEVTKANNDVLKGIQTVSRGFANGSVKIGSKCENVWRELGLYRWDERKSEREGRDCVIKENDHMLDQCRYMCQFLRDYVPGLNGEDD